MKTSLAITLTIAVLFSYLIWNQKNKGDSLLSEQQILLKETAKKGSVTRSTPRTAKRNNRSIREKIDPAAFAAELMRYNRDMKLLMEKGDHGDDKMLTKKIISQMDQLQALSNTELSEVIMHISHAKEFDLYERRRLSWFLLDSLTKHDPHLTLNTLLDSDLRRFLSQYNNDDSRYVNKALESLASKSPDTAIDWFRSHSDIFSKPQQQLNYSALVRGIARVDYAKALEICDESEQGKSMIPNLVFLVPRDSASRLAALNGLRQWSKRHNHSEGSQTVLSNSVMRLAHGGRVHLDKADFGEVMTWMKQAKVTQGELGAFVRTSSVDLIHYIKPEQAGEWAEWLGYTFSEDQSTRRLKQLATSNRTKKYIKKWITTAADGPAKKIITQELEQ
ncbi:hypothetical protein NT6N_31930 [Oceaniferula spumae]|uniref:HEAT repeat domain-containing protein n=1 Tax=Oceaniferula spumae TaxID=2979115 RepID=A0AAT9FQ95_9BACT